MSARSRTSGTRASKRFATSANFGSRAAPLGGVFLEPAQLLADGAVGGVEAVGAAGREVAQLLHAQQLRPRIRQFDLFTGDELGGFQFLPLEADEVQFAPAQRLAFAQRLRLPP